MHAELHLIDSRCQGLNDPESERQVADPGGDGYKFRGLRQLNRRGPRIGLIASTIFTLCSAPGPSRSHGGTPAGTSVPYVRSPRSRSRNLQELHSRHMTSINLRDTKETASSRGHLVAIIPLSD